MYCIPSPSPWWRVSGRPLPPAEQRPRPRGPRGPRCAGACSRWWWLRRGGPCAAAAAERSQSCPAETQYAGVSGPPAQQHTAIRTHEILLVGKEVKDKQT